VDAVRVTDPYETGRPTQVEVDHVGNRDDVVGVLRAMINDFRKNPDAWENTTLDRYLDGLATAMEGLDQVYAERGEVAPPQPSWLLVAELLVAASGYE
jgi:hypothetical protein